MQNIFVCIFVLLASLSSCRQNSNINAFGDEFSKPWLRHKVYTLRLVETMPETFFTFKPTPEIRTFAEVAMHVAATNFGFVAGFSGKEFPVDQETLNYEGKSKDEIVRIIADSFDFANSMANSLTPEQLKETVPWGNPIEPETTRTKLEVFHILREHAAHERGAITIYLRLKGIEPPAYID